MQLCTSALPSALHGPAAGLPVHATSSGSDPHTPPKIPRAVSRRRWAEYINIKRHYICLETLSQTANPKKTQNKAKSEREACVYLKLNPYLYREIL